MSSDPRDDRDRPDNDDRNRDDYERRQPRRDDYDDRDRDSRRRPRRDDDDFDDRPRRRRSHYDDDYDYRRRRNGSSNTLIIVLSIVGVVVIGGGFALYFAVGKVRDAALRAKLHSNLAQFAIAMHNHEGATGHFPMAVCDKQGKPLLSWRVALLPYIEHMQLYNQFNLDEPWDSPTNIKLLVQMPIIYRTPNHPEVDAQNKTFYRMIIPKGETASAISFNDLRKGNNDPSSLVMIVEAGEPVLWTKPDEIEYDESKPLPSMGGMTPKSDTFRVAMFDGSVRAIRRDESEAFLRGASRRPVLRAKD